MLGDDRPGVVTTSKVFFTREQYAYLSKLFPEFIGTSATEPLTRVFHAGTRQVVQHIGSRVHE